MTKTIQDLNYPRLSRFYGKYYSIYFYIKSTYLVHKIQEITTGNFPVDFCTKKYTYKINWEKHKNQDFYKSSPNLKN